VSESEGETRRHFYDAIGDLTVVAGDTAKSRYTYDAAGRLSRIAHDAPDQPPALTDLRYDGRGFLRRAELRRFPAHAANQPSVETTATYSSEGLLYHRGHVEKPDPAAARGTPVTADNVMVFYFAGRPVAQVVVAGQGEVVTYLTADHLGTPVLATNSAMGHEWSGGFEPFGADWTGAGKAGIFLRLPGQWVDSGWEGGLAGGPLYYNLHRWYQPESDRYNRPDPLGVSAGVNVFLYASSNPVSYFDALGLRPICCKKPWDACWSDCIEAGRLDYWQVIPFSAFPKRILPPFRVPNPNSPLTTIPSSIGHLVGGRTSSVGSVLRTSGRFLSRVATPLTVFEGFYDLTTVIACVGKCASNPCRRFLPFSDLFTVTAADIPFLFK
jgi:RHS repeat-associated protein